MVILKVACQGSDGITLLGSRGKALIGILGQNPQKLMICRAITAHFQVHVEGAIIFLALTLVEEY